MNEQELEIVDLFTNQKTRTEATYKLAEYIVHKYNIITIGERQMEMFVYQEGIYIPAENLIIDPEIQRILSYHVTKNAKSETLHKIIAMTSHPRSIFSNVDKRYIPLKNGVYDLGTDQLLPHSPEYRFTYKFPIEYNMVAKAIKTEAFFDQVLNPEQRLIIEEWLGYYFYRNYQFKKALIMVGEGDTGKTTLIQVINNLLGVENTSSISLHRMASDKFSAAHLYKKHGNIVDELSANDINDTGAFKIATGDGSITGEHKFGNQFIFHNHAKFTFACNKIPDVKDTDDVAYFNRWMVIRFENKIEKKIPNFVETVTTEEERSGLFNLAMDGLKRLLEQGEFTYKNSAEETKTEMMRSGSSIGMFVSDMLQQDDKSEITKEDLYDSYVKYCKTKNITKQTIKMFGTRLHGYIPFISDGAKFIKNEKGKNTTQAVWRNVKVRGGIIKEEKKEEVVDWKEFDANYQN